MKFKEWMKIQEIGIAGQKDIRHPRGASQYYKQVPPLVSRGVAGLVSGIGGAFAHAKARTGASPVYGTGDYLPSKTTPNTIEFTATVPKIYGDLSGRQSIESAKKQLLDNPTVADMIAKGEIDGRFASEVERYDNGKEVTIVMSFPKGQSTTGMDNEA